MTLKKNTRRNLRKDRNKIRRLNPKIIINNFSDFDNLVKLSKKRFEEKGEKTDWEDERRVEAFRQVIKLSGKSYSTRMISVKIDEKIAGVDLIAIFNNTYYTLKCGYNVKEFSGIGNFVNLFEIDDAISLGMKKIDFLQNSYQWKNKFFKPIPLLKYEK
jgi:CelD/BcsL family acetyltransferase involved in cellulose biosynthesis